MQTIRDARDREAFANIKMYNVIARRRGDQIEFGRVNSYNMIEQKAVMINNQNDMDARVLEEFRGLSAAQVKALPFVNAVPFLAEPVAARRPDVVRAYPNAVIPDEEYENLPIAPSASAGIAAVAPVKLSPRRQELVDRLAGYAPLASGTGIGPGSKFDELEQQIAYLKANGAAAPERDDFLDRPQRLYATHLPTQRLPYLNTQEQYRLKRAGEYEGIHKVGNYPMMHGGRRETTTVEKLAAPLALFAVTVAATVIGSMSA